MFEQQDNEKKGQKELAADVKAFIKQYEFQVNFNRGIGIVLNIIGISLSLCVTVAGLNNNAQLAAGLGAASAAIQSILSVFPLEKRVLFYRVMIAEGKNLYDDLTSELATNEPKVVFEKFKSLRTKTLTQEPLNNKLSSSKEPSESTESSSIYQQNIN
jgi:hypothetical protein